MIPRPDSEAAWVAWLRAAGHDARTTIPDDHVDGMIRVSRVGGERQGPILESVEMLFEVWHSSPLAASTLAHTINARVEDAENGKHFKHHLLKVPVEFPDDNSALARYQFTASCIARRV